MAIQYSIQKMVSDGTLSTIALGIQYLQRNDIYIRIAGEDTPQSGAPSGYTWSFLDNTTLKILPVVPNGVEVVVYRRTDVDAMYNIYSQNAQFDEATIDENNQQLLYIAQEYLEQGLPGAGVDTIEYVRDDGSFTYYRMRRTDGSYSEEFTVPSASSVTKILARESIRRSYAEAGYNLVGGSFQVGFSLVNANDVALDGVTGKAYSGAAGTYPAGTSTAGFVDRSLSWRTVFLSKYGSLGSAIAANSLTKKLTVIVDADSIETSPVSFAGDIDITGKGVITLQSGVTNFLSHSDGNLTSGRGVKYTTQDQSSVSNITAISSTRFSKIHVSSILDRVSLRPRNPISSPMGDVIFDGTVTGDFSAMTTPVNEAVIFVEAARSLNVGGMENYSTGCERLIKCSHSVESFSMELAKIRGSVKRQFVDTYIDTRKVICRNNDVDITGCESFIEGKLKTETDLPGVVPKQVLVDISRNVFKIGSDLCQRIALFQAPGGTSEAPVNYESLFVADTNVIHGRTSSTTFDVRGFSVYEEKETVYRNVSLNDRPTVTLIACDKISVSGIDADSYAVNILGSGSSQGGIAYSRSPKKISVKDCVVDTYNNAGFVFLNGCSSVKSLSVTNNIIDDPSTSPATSGLVYVANSTVARLVITKNTADFTQSIPLRQSNSTINSIDVSWNSWQVDYATFTGQAIANGASVTVPFPNLNGNFVGGSERISVSFNKDAKGCVISGYKTGATFYATIKNTTGASQTIDTGYFYIETAKLF